MKKIFILIIIMFVVFAGNVIAGTQKQIYVMPTISDKSFDEFVKSDKIKTKKEFIKRLFIEIETKLVDNDVVLCSVYDDNFPEFPKVDESCESNDDNRIIVYILNNQLNKLQVLHADYGLTQIYAKNDVMLSKEESTSLINKLVNLVIENANKIRIKINKK